MSVFMRKYNETGYLDLHTEKVIKNEKALRKEERKVRKKSVYNAARTNNFYTAEEKNYEN